MKTIDDIHVPETLADITLGQYIRVQQFTDNTLNDQMKAVTILTDIADNPDWNVFIDVTIALADMDWNIGAPADKVVVDGVEYRLRSFDDLTTAEFIDFDTLLAEHNASTFSTLAAIAYTNGEGGSDYVEATKKRARVFFDKMDALTAMSAINFFVRSSKDYLRTIADSSQYPKELKEMAVKILALADGGGN